jgi:hypothetical protein
MLPIACALESLLSKTLLNAISASAAVQCAKNDIVQRGAQSVSEKMKHTTQASRQCLQTHPESAVLDGQQHSRFGQMQLAVAAMSGTP